MTSVPAPTRRRACRAPIAIPIPTALASTPAGNWTCSAASDLDALQVAVVGEVADSYIELRGLQERLRVARRNAENQGETLRLVQARLDAGRGSDFATARARAQREATLARIPALEAAAAVHMHRLAVLVGLPPEALITELEQPASLPALPGRLDPG